MSRRVTAGGVVFEDSRHVYLVKPSNDFGPWEFPKGGVEPRETLEEAALREVREETGVPARVLRGGYLGEVLDHQENHYFAMARCGPIGDHDWEVEEVLCASLGRALDILVRAGNARDVEVLRRVAKFLNS